MALITDWKEAYKFLSVQGSALGFSTLVTYMVLYDRLEKVVPPKYMFGVAAGLFVLVVLGRVTKQDIPLADDSM